MSKTNKARAVYVSCMIFILLVPAMAYGGEREEKIMEMYFGEDASIIVPTRYLRPVSLSVENMTVITAEQMKELNIHTVAEALNTIPGIQMEMNLVYGNYSILHAQGSGYNHVKVMIDGITINDLSNHFAAVGNLPVQNIYRIEIIKGAASSTWGSALGGVINIVTKSGEYNNEVSGTFSSSYGGRNTSDNRAELIGNPYPFAYYLYAGGIRSNGFAPGTAYNNTSFYTREELKLSKTVTLSYTLGYNGIRRGVGEFAEDGVKLNNNTSLIYSTLKCTATPSKQLELSLALRYLRQENTNLFTDLSSLDTVESDKYLDQGGGGTFNITMKPGMHTIVFGSEYDDMRLTAKSLTEGGKASRRLAVYANDSLKMGKLTIVPGIRYETDSADNESGILSPSLGATYLLTGTTIVRAYMSRGFYSPPFNELYGKSLYFFPNPDLKAEKAWSYSTGIESRMLTYLWFRFTLFRNDISNALTHVSIDESHSTTINQDKQTRQGFEVEVENAPIYNLTFTAGYSYINAKNLNTGQFVEGAARHTINTGLRYKTKTFTGFLTGRYIEWAGVRPVFNNHDGSFIFDLSLTKKFRMGERFPGAEADTSAFLTIHNIFNGSQYFDSYYQNPGRWIEGGVRFHF